MNVNLNPLLKVWLPGLAVAVGHGAVQGAWNAASKYMDVNPLTGVLVACGAGVLGTVYAYTKTAPKDNPANPANQ